MGLMEECILIDGTILNEIIVPTTNVDRQLSDGSRHKEEIVNKSQIYITTAGWKNSFPYDKLIEILISSIIDPEQYMIIGGTYEVPIHEGLLSEDFVDELKLQGTFDDSSFDREYRSIWSGDAQKAFFSNDIFEKHRQLALPEEERSGKGGKGMYYVIGVDVGRIGCTTEAMIIKVTPQPQGPSMKSIVNIFTFEAEHFEAQAIHIKKLYYKYKAKKLVIDANGLGVGLVDFMVLSQTDPDTGDILPPFGVENDPKGLYKQFKIEGNEKEAMYLIKADATLNTEAHSYVQSQLRNGKIKFLITEKEAKIKLMSTKVGQAMTIEERAVRILPYQLTTILKNQMLNLIEESEGTNIKLKRFNAKIPKDKFSALEYGLYYIKLDEDKRRKRHSSRLKDFMFFNNG